MLIRRATMARQVPEWIGKTDDSPIPDRVKLRIHDAAHGLCTVCGLTSTAYDIDHTIALCNGGKNRENNLSLLCLRCHKAKTRKDVAEKALVYRKKKKALLRKPSSFRGWRKMDGTIVLNKKNPRPW